MWAGFFCRQDVSISIFGCTKEFSEVRGTSSMCNFGVRSRFLDVIYGVRPPNGSPVGQAPGVGLGGAGGGQTFIFSEHGHVAHQIEGEDERN